VIFTFGVDAHGAGENVQAEQSFHQPVRQARCIIDLGRSPDMRRLLLAFLLACLALSPIQSAKAGPMDTVKIIITGGGLTAPIEITDRAVLDDFKVWAGPGNFRREGSRDIPIQFDHGFIVDWSRGSADAPKGLKTFTVSFVTTRTGPSTYIVRYVIDPSSKNGYVYLPGEGEPEYKDNAFLILRGVEGRWFHSWSRWEAVANPLIASAPKAP
jgi:hypothetical protein